MTYRTILVPLDESTFGEQALPYALGIARRGCATVHLVHVLASQHETRRPGQTAVSERERVAAYLDGLAAVLSENWEVVIHTAVLDGPIADTISHHARAIGADLVVMTTHGRGPVTRAWLGSVADTLVRRMALPLLLVRPGDTVYDELEAVHNNLFHHIVVPLDGSLLAESVLEPAIELGRLTEARLTLLEVITPQIESYPPISYGLTLNQDLLDRWMCEARIYLSGLVVRLHPGKVPIQPVVVVGQPFDCIQDYVREHAADLIVMATHGRGGLSRLMLGSVADQVIRGASAPVLVYPAPDTSHAAYASDRQSVARAP